MPRPAEPIITWTMGLTFLLMCATAWAGPARMFAEDRWHVALDAGHGGDDTGARGPTGLLEKAVCLELARTLTLRLETRHRVTLTRSDDYRVQLRQRAAIANQAKADLYISLHMAASFQHAARGTVIYYHVPSKKISKHREENRTPVKPQPWNQVQIRHHSNSQTLAAILKQHLERQLGVPEIRVVGAPLALLEGVDMPAVLIELGHITNPATEQRMASSQAMPALAGAIDTGVNAYIQSQAAQTQP